MQKMNYSMLVSDFDGTLVKADGTVSEYTRERIRRYTETGGRFVISTGRMPSGIVSQVKELGLTGLLCCGQGAVILDIESGERVFENRMSNEISVKICEEMERLHLHIQVYDFWEYYSNMQDEALEWYEKAVKAKAVVVADKPMSVYLKETGIQPYKILAIVPPEENARIFSAMQSAGFSGCQVTKSAVNLVEIGNANNSKGTAVEFLASRYGVPMEKIIAVGDQLNDLPMIERAGLGIAVQNADGQLKAKAKRVSEYTNEQDAVAKIIETYGCTEDKQ